MLSILKYDEVLMLPSHALHCCQCIVSQRMYTFRCSQSFRYTHGGNATALALIEREAKGLDIRVRG